MNFPFKKIAAIFILLAGLCSCGFRVIYDESNKEIETSYIDELATIRVQKDRSRLGQKMRNNLYDVMNPGSLKMEPKFFLTLTTTSALAPTYITTTGASGRSRVALTVSYELRSLKNGVIISSGSTEVNDNYDMTSNRYATYKSGVFAEGNLTKIAAQNIRNSIVNDLVELHRKCVEKTLGVDVDPLLCESL